MAMALEICFATGPSGDSFNVWLSPQGAKRVMLVDSVSRFSEHIEASELRLPSSTMVFEEERKVIN